MPTQEASGFCKSCDKQMMVRRKSTNHLMHVIITIVLGVVRSVAERLAGLLISQRMDLAPQLVIGQEIEIIYHGGSQPGARRQVVAEWRPWW